MKFKIQDVKVDFKKFELDFDNVFVKTFYIVFLNWTFEKKLIIKNLINSKLNDALDKINLYKIISINAND